MREERNMAIIGIVLPIIGFFAMMTTYDSVAHVFVPTVLPVGMEYTDAIKYQIWKQELIVICALLAFQIYYYVTIIIEGVKGKKKSIVVWSIIGLLIGIGFLFSGFAGSGPYLMLFLNLPFSIIFSIVMFIRSFRKHQVWATVTILSVNLPEN
jgi:hypothetical protein